MMFVIFTISAQQKPFCCCYRDSDSDSPSDQIQIQNKLRLSRWRPRLRLRLRLRSDLTRRFVNGRPCGGGVMMRVTQWVSKKYDLHSYTHNRHLHKLNRTQRMMRNERDHYFCNHGNVNNHATDSSTALRVMQLVSQVASMGTTVICSVHQPRPEVVSLIHKVCMIWYGIVGYDTIGYDTIR